MNHFRLRFFPAGQKRKILRRLRGNAIDNDNCTWYVDTGTGDDLNRPEFERWQRDVFHGEIRTVVVWKLDRLSRSIRDGINTLAPAVGGAVFDFGLNGSRG